MSTQATETNPLALSDEDFLNQTPPSLSAPVNDPVQKTQEELDAEAAAAEADRLKAEQEAKAAEEAAKSAPVVAETTETPGKQGVNGGNVHTNPEVDKDGKPATATASTDPNAASGTSVAKTDPAQKKDDAAATPAAKSDEAGTQATTVNYEQFYKQVMAPFKANGKTIELRTPEEAVQLMQMGANYTRKMQDIQPHRKTLLMLENAQLLDPDKLSFLIDVSNGDQKAIQKLLKDKGVDPMSIDTSEDSNYLGGNHKVSDDEANFRTTLSDLGSSEEGKQTLQAVNSTWDQASKEVLWKQPDILTVIHQQRENGVYDRISTEVNRLQALGQIPAGTPFIQAYKAVGDVMQSQGKLADLVKPSPAGSAETVHTHTQAEPVVTRVAAPKSSVANGEQASAAAATRSTPGKAEKVVNPLALSDDEFLKQMQNRV
ncbi:hypothetical protein SB861_37740 [Paraburkholderia sp. SIMBA_049]